MKFLFLKLAVFSLFVFATNCIIREVFVPPQGEKTFGAPMPVAPEYYYRVEPTVPFAPPNPAPVATPATVRPASGLTLSPADAPMIMPEVVAPAAVLVPAATTIPPKAPGYYPPRNSKSYRKNVRYYNPYHHEDDRSTPLKKTIP